MEPVGKKVKIVVDPNGDEKQSLQSYLNSVYSAKRKRQKTEREKFFDNVLMKELRDPSNLHPKK